MPSWEKKSQLIGNCVTKRLDNLTWRIGLMSPCPDRLFFHNTVIFEEGLLTIQRQQMLRNLLLSLFPTH